MLVGNGPKAQTPAMPVLLVKGTLLTHWTMQLRPEAGEKRPLQDSAAAQDRDVGLGQAGGLGRNICNLLLF